MTNNTILFLTSAIAIVVIVEYLILKLLHDRKSSANNNAFNQTIAKLQAEIDKEQLLRQQTERHLKERENAHLQELQQLRKDLEQQRQRELEETQRSYEENLQYFKSTIKADTEKLLIERSESLQKSNNQQMESILKPLKDNIDSMQQSITNHRESQAKNTENITQSIKQMMDRTIEIGTQADRLSNALQSKNKTMGNWGELVLTRLLESQGLQEGIHYDAQPTLRDKDGKAILNEESNKRMIPDIILHLADNRDVIIDAKVSITAFADYQNALTEDEKNEAARRHIESIKNHVKELSSKRYNDYIVAPRICSDFVIMFVPHEGAMQLLMASDPQLWNEAFNKHKVFIVGGQNLIAATHIIELTWRQVLQDRNTQKVMEEASKLIDRVRTFYERFLAVESSLQEAQKNFDSLRDKVLTGKQSIMTSARSLESLGVKGKKALPAPDVDE